MNEATSGPANVERLVRNLARARCNGCTRTRFESIHGRMERVFCAALLRGVLLAPLGLASLGVGFGSARGFELCLELGDGRATLRLVDDRARAEIRGLGLGHVRALRFGRGDGVEALQSGLQVLG